MWSVAEWGKYKEKKAFNWLKINSVFMNMLANFTEGWDFFIFSFIRDTGGNFSILKGIFFFFLDSVSFWAVCWHLTLFCDCTWRWGSAHICFCFEIELTFLSSLRAAAGFLLSASQNDNTNRQDILPIHSWGNCYRASNDLLLFVVTITEVVGVGDWKLANLILSFLSHPEGYEEYL